MENDLPGVLGITNQYVALSADTSTVLWDFFHDRWISWHEPLAESGDVRCISSRFSSSLGGSPLELLHLQQQHRGGPQ